jgi:hypothetical protein
MTTTDEIRADIEATRAELAETADALAARLDQKAQAAKRAAIIVAGAAAFAVVMQRLWKLRKQRS